MKRFVVTMLIECLLLSGSFVAAAAQDRQAELLKAGRLDQEAGRLYNAKRYNEAIVLEEESLAILEKILGPEHDIVASSLESLATLYEAIGDYARAETLLERALAIALKVGADRPKVAKLYGNIATVYFYRGDYTRAESSVLRALKIYEKMGESQRFEIAKLHNDLGVMYFARGDNTNAKVFLLLALPDLEKTLGPEHPEVAKVFNNLAVLELRERNHAEAESYLRRALAIHQKADPKGHIAAPPLINLALLYHDKGDYEQAEALYRRGLVIFEKTLGLEHPEVAMALSKLALLYHARGDYVRAQPALERALAIREKRLTADHPDVAASINELGHLYFARDDYDRAVQFLARGNTVEERSLALILTTGSERQKQLYLNTISNSLHAVVSLHVRALPQNEQAARLALTAILQRKGRALDAMTDQLLALRRHASPQDQELLDQLTKLRNSAATLQLSNEVRSSPEMQRIVAGVARFHIEEKENEISRRSAEFRAQSLPITLEAVRQAIPAGAALVEICAYEPYDAKAKNATVKRGEARYVAYVLRRDEAAPRSVELGEAAVIDAEVERLRAALKETRREDVQTIARAVDERVMRPIRKLLGPARQLLLSPDGTLNLIPFSALVDERGRYLIENYSLTYLTSGRDLLRLQVPTESRSAPVVIANPLYDLRAGARPGPAGKRANKPASKADANRLSTDFTLKRYGLLPGTAEEANALAKLLPQGTQVLLQERATEAALKEVNRPRVLHVATHGFFLTEQSQVEPTNSRLLRGTFDTLDTSSLPVRWENPLLRSGLVLAGVNQGWSGAGEDGVLTALEVAGLDLWGTKLVVLSACETGLGEVTNGAGIYGLRRALVLAGSETQVMSLWKVSDNGTKDLMTAYYSRLRAGEGRTEALRQVQLAMLRGELRPAAATPGARPSPRATGAGAPSDYSHPYYWASFIPSGDWRSMEGN